MCTRMTDNFMSLVEFSVWNILNILIGKFSNPKNSIILLIKLKTIWKDLMLKVSVI